MPKPTKIFDKAVLENLYLIEKKNPYEIAIILSCNHKTIRKKLKDFNIPLRNISESTALARKYYTEPDDTLLFSKPSLILHTIYKCEGCSGPSIKSLRFQNQDPNLIQAFYNGILKIYKYETEMTLSFLYNFQCEKSKKTIELYKLIFKDLIIQNINIPTNKNPIIRINVGGIYLYRLFMKNTAKIFNSIPLSI